MKKYIIMRTMRTIRDIHIDRRMEKPGMCEGSCRKIRVLWKCMRDKGFSSAEYCEECIHYQVAKIEEFDSLEEAKKQLEYLKILGKL